MLLKEDITGKPAPEAIQILIRDIKNIKVVRSKLYSFIKHFVRNH